VAISLIVDASPAFCRRISRASSIRQPSGKKSLRSQSKGMRPLSPESMPYTQAILASGRFRKLPTALVTNGVHLGGAIDQLKMLSPHKIAISLDAVAAEHHDRIRGVPGTWAAAVRNIERALAVLAPQTRIVVSFVLQPSKRHDLEAMPARLREIGFDRWIITPLLRVGADKTGGLLAIRLRFSAIL
jgi:MoaA/NifB/PqqE/SkfB family radical SAM enzyme